MKIFNLEKTEAWAAHAKKFDCAHEYASLRRRTIKGGQVQFVYQCLDCGESKNQPVAHSKVFSIPPAFDETLRTNRQQARIEAANAINQRFGGDAFFNHYDPYLNSTAWRDRRAHVMTRAKGRCEGCAESAATEVHHLTYAHVGDEFLFELVALCRSCHERLHVDPNKIHYSS